MSTGTISPAMVPVADRAPQLVGGDLLLAEELLEGASSSKCATASMSSCAVLVGLLRQVGRDVDRSRSLAPRSSSPCQTQRLHGDEVDDALVVALGADRELEDGGVALEAVLDRVEAARSRRRGGPSC